MIVTDKYLLSEEEEKKLILREYRGLLRQLKHRLKKGDKILTIGGIYGKIADIKEDGTIIMEVEDGSKMKISKNAVSQDATSTLNQQ